MSGFRCQFCKGSLTKVHYPKLYNMAHLLSLNVFTASKGSNNYILFAPTSTCTHVYSHPSHPATESTRTQVNSHPGTCLSHYPPTYLPTLPPTYLNTYLPPFIPPSLQTCIPTSPTLHTPPCLHLCLPTPSLHYLTSHSLPPYLYTVPP